MAFRTDAIEKLHKRLFGIKLLFLLLFSSQVVGAIKDVFFAENADKISIIVKFTFAFINLINRCGTIGNIAWIAFLIIWYCIAKNHYNKLVEEFDSLKAKKNSQASQVAQKAE